MQALADSDALRAKALATSDPVLLVDALELAAVADGCVFALDGTIADVGYAQRRTEAIRAAAGRPDLLARIHALPDVDRGAVRGASLTRLDTGPRGWSQRIAFRGREVALVYARSGGGQPLTLTIRAGDRTICRIGRPSGRALCRWNPATAETATISVNGAKHVAFDLVTN